MTYVAHNTINISLVCPAQAARLCLFYHTSLELAAAHCSVLEPNLLTTCTAFLPPNLEQRCRRGTGCLVVNWAGDGLELRFVHSQWYVGRAWWSLPSKSSLSLSQCMKHSADKASVSPFSSSLSLKGCFQFQMFPTVGSSDVSDSGFRAASKGSSSAQSIGRWVCLGRPYIVPWKTVSIEAQTKLISTVLAKGA